MMCIFEVHCELFIFLRRKQFSLSLNSKQIYDKIILNLNLNTLHYTPQCASKITPIHKSLFTTNQTVSIRDQVASNSLESAASAPRQLRDVEVDSYTQEYS